MPWPGPPMHQHLQPPQGPLLCLFPLNDSFIPKQIALPPGSARVKIGRQTNAKTVPGERNGYFDSKVLSRQHAEIWEEAGKIFIKDVKSSNGTFVNGDRLSLEGVESDPWELKSDDIVEFGIDIVGEDNKTIIHHKVAAQVRCILTTEDFAQLASSMHQNQQHHPQQHQNGTFRMQEPGQRRPSIQQATSPGGLGGMGGGPGLGLSGRSGKSGLTFDHILNRLQNELQKSRETGSDLNALSGVMSDINETLIGGAVPPSLPPNIALPPVRPPPPPHPVEPTNQASSSPGSSGDSALSLNSLQSQLIQTQSTLASHAEKVKSLESVIEEHEQVKHEVQLMRDLMEQRKREMEGLLMSASAFRHQNGELRTESDAQRESRRREDEGSDSDDDSDTRSVMTVMPEDGEGDVDTASRRRRSALHEEEEVYSAEEEARDARARSEAMGRPRTPEPHGLSDEYDDEQDQPNEHHHLRRQHQFNGTASLMPPSSSSSFGFSSSSANPSPSSPPPPPPPAPPQPDLHSQNALLETRLETLANQLDTAITLSRTLQAQAEAAQVNIELLEAKVSSLEAFAQEAAKQRDERSQQKEEEEQTESSQGVTAAVWDAWRLRVESEWKVEREEWVNERVRLKQAVKEWEERMSEVERRERERVGEMERREKEMLAVLAASRRRDASSDEDGEWDGSHDESLTNGVIEGGGPSKRWPPATNAKSPNKVRKQLRRSSHQQQSSVTTPPHSPTLINGNSPGSLDLSSEEGSASRSSSPVKPGKKHLNLNGHAHVDVLPISPAPSVRNGNASDGRRTGSGDSEVEREQEDGGSAISGSDLVEQPSGVKLGKRRGASLGDNPLPYLSAAGVVFIGIAAWAVVNRVKD